MCSGLGKSGVWRRYQDFNVTFESENGFNTKFRFVIRDKHLTFEDFEDFDHYEFRFVQDEIRDQFFGRY